MRDYERRDKNFYLRQGGSVFVAVGLSVCVCLCAKYLKQLRRDFDESFGRVMGRGRVAQRTID